VFLSVDPRSEEYIFQSAYAYAANNPIKYLDVNGEGPGDPFETIEEAVADWASNYNEKSIKLDTEFASEIYSYTIENKTVYSYSDPNDGGNSSVRESKRPEETELIALIHSHAAFKLKLESGGPKLFDLNGNNDFSLAHDGGTGDLEYFEERGVGLGFVVTPSGEVKRWEKDKSLMVGGDTDITNLINSILGEQKKPSVYVDKFYTDWVNKGSPKPSRDEIKRNEADIKKRKKEFRKNK